jgi:hypothetical protein
MRFDQVEIGQTLEHRANCIGSIKLKSATIVLTLLVLNGCVASVREVTLSKALTDVIDGMDAMRKHQQDLAKDPKYRYLATYVKDVKVTFNVSVAGDVNFKGEGSGGYGPAKGDLVVTTDYKSSRANQITIDLGSLLDNQAITGGKVAIDANGYVHYGNAGKGPTDRPIINPLVQPKPRPIQNPIQLATPTPPPQ